jgi:hypothetical protein
MGGLVILVLCLHWAILGWAGQDDRDPRLLLDDPQSILTELNAMKRRIQALEAQATVSKIGSGE